jgi:hypothetical protein
MNKRAVAVCVGLAAAAAAVSALTVAGQWSGDGSTSASTLAEPQGQTLEQRFGEKFQVLRGTVVNVEIRRTDSVKDNEQSQNSSQRAAIERTLKEEDRWAAFIDVSVNDWIRGNGHRGDGPQSIVATRGVSFTSSGESAGSTLSTDLSDPAVLDTLKEGTQFEFVVKGDKLYGRYYGLVAAFALVDGIPQEVDFEGRRRFEISSPADPTPFGD